LRGVSGDDAKMRMVNTALTALMLGALLGACGTPAKPQDYAVEAAATSTQRFPESVRVTPVKTLAGSAWGRPSIDPAVFAEGLRQTLASSQLFKAVTADAGAALEMNTEIIYQQSVDPYSITLPLLVHYDLKDTRTGRTIWKGNFFSLPDVPGGRSFGDPTGSARHSLVVREAIRDNFSQLVRGLSQDPIRR